MNPIQEQISEILRKHQPKDKADDTSRPGFRVWRSGCSGCEFSADKSEAIDHCDHLAAVLVSKLGLAKSLGGQWICFNVPWDGRD